MKAEVLDRITTPSGKAKGQRRVTSQTVEPKIKALTKPQEKFADRVIAAAYAKIQEHTPDETAVSQTVKLLPWRDQMDKEYQLERKLREAELDAKLQFIEGMKLAAFILGNKKDEIVNTAQAA